MAAIHVAEKVLDDLPGPLHDVDVAPTGTWIGVAGGEEALWLVSDRPPVLLPFGLLYAQVRIVDENTVLVVRSRTRRQPNAWLVTTDGEVLAHFFVGDGVEDVLVAGRRLVVTYFDEGIFGHGPIADEGVAVFDLDGTYLWGYRSTLGEAAVPIYDCHCACLTETGELLFLPYDEYPLVRLDLETRTQEIWPTPETLHMSRAITSRGAEVYFHGPDGTRAVIFAWVPGSGAPQRLDTFPGRLRGLTGGHFLVVSESGFSVMSITRWGIPWSALSHDVGNGRPLLQRGTDALG